jgi:hypothetical protein
MEGVNEVQGEWKGNPPPEGTRAGQFVHVLTLTRLSSGAKRCNSVWKKASPAGRGP